MLSWDSSATNSLSSSFVTTSCQDKSPINTTISGILMVSLDVADAAAISMTTYPDATPA
jgi:hypothetical protein